MGLGDGSSISWTICKQSAPPSRQITTPTPHHSIFTGWILLWGPISVKALKDEGTCRQTNSEDAITITWDVSVLSPLRVAERDNQCKHLAHRHCYYVTQNTLPIHHYTTYCKASFTSHELNWTKLKFWIRPNQWKRSHCTNWRLQTPICELCDLIHCVCSQSTRGRETR